MAEINRWTDRRVRIGLTVQQGHQPGHGQGHQQAERQRDPHHLGEPADERCADARADEEREGRDAEGDPAPVSGYRSATDETMAGRPTPNATATSATART